MSSDQEGHNSIGLTEVQFNDWLPKLTRAEAEAKMAKEKVNTIRKGMRADGIKLKVFDAYRHLADLTRDEQCEHLAHSAMYLKWLRSPLAEQISMNFERPDPLTEDDDAVAARVIEDAKGAGWRAGLSGSMFEADCPHDENTPQGQAWIGAYREGQEQAALALGDGAKGAAPKEGKK